ncbi:MAG: hypothetical protein ACKN9V_08250 [Pseudomonadota bacterium]
MNPLAKKQPCFSPEAGLFLFRPHRGEPSTAFALQCLKTQGLGSSLSPTSTDYGVFISEEGTLYPPALQKWQINLSQFLIIRTDTALQTWKSALDAIQTGLFRWIFLRTSKPCDVTHLRKLQLESERKKTSVFLFSKAQLPHWFFKKSFPSLPALEVSHEASFITENIILSNPNSPFRNC